MTRSGRRLREGILPISRGTILAGALVVAVIGASATAGALVGEEGTPGTVDCSTVAIPEDRELNTLLDKENGVLHISFLDDSTGEDRTVAIDYLDADCAANKDIVELIDHAVAVDASTQIAQCLSIKELIDHQATVDERGLPIDLEAARRYLQQWCPALTV